MIMKNEIFLLKMKNDSLRKKNMRLRLNLLQFPDLAEKVAPFKIYGVDRLPKNVALLSLNQMARQLGMAPCVLYNRLRKYNIVRKEDHTWILHESLRDESFAVYVIGERNCYSSLQLRLTSVGVNAITDILCMENMKVETHK